MIDRTFSVSIVVNSHGRYGFLSSKERFVFRFQQRLDTLNRLVTEVQKEFKKVVLKFPRMRTSKSKFCAKILLFVKK